MKTMQQIEITLDSRPRGFHIITDEVVKKLHALPQSGLLHLFLKHTSAGLTINENADSTVREDFEAIFNRLVPEDQPYYKHTFEGSDDMPAHVKASLVGTSLSIPITNGKLNLGTWQGIYLCEFRNRGGSRTVLATLID
jgi:secondary thiamine-phosphate synthase enzyme